MDKKIKLAIVSFPINTLGGGFDIFYNWFNTLDKTAFEIHFITCSNHFSKINNRMENLPHVRTVNLTSLSKWYFFYIPGIISLVKYMRSNNIEIVHTSMIQADILGSFAAKLAKTPIIVSTVIGYLINTNSGLLGKIKTSIYKTAYKVSKRWFNRILTISKATFDELVLDFEVDKEIMEVNYCGIELPKKEFVTLTRRKEEQVVGVLGELIHAKGMWVFVESIPLILDKFPHTKFVIAGDGKEKTSLEKRVKDLKLDDKVTFLGWVDNPREVIKNMDIFVFPSLPSYDGLPRVILEAWALGTPVITTRVACVPELFDGKNKGLTINPSCHKEIAASVLKLLRDPQMAKKMASNALEDIKTFDKNNEIIRMQNIYKELYKINISN